MASLEELKVPDAVRKGKKSFFLLDRDYYTSEKIFEREYERVYSRDWIYAGHVSQLPERGDYLMFKYGREEIVVVRGDGGRFFANLNVCRHRGYRLCAEVSGHVNSFVCNYHQWTYNLDGSLKYVPRMPDGQYFDYCKFGLRSAQVEVWNGMIFVCLGDGKIEPIRDRFASLESTVAKFSPTTTKLAYAKKYQIAANWKLVVDNAFECYHCPANHPSLCGVIDVPRLMSDLKEWFSDDNDETKDLGASGMHVKPGMKTMSGDGSLICEKLLGNLTAKDAADGITCGVMLVPNPTFIMFYVDHWWTIAVRPQSATETELVYSWYVRDDAIEVKDYDIARLIEVGDNTQMEDNILIERTQRGVNSRYYAPGPIGSDVEPALYDFMADYKKFMDRGANAGQ
jgi:glycine betaine catabolism A